MSNALTLTKTLVQGEIVTFINAGIFYRGEVKASTVAPVYFVELSEHDNDRVLIAILGRGFRQVVNAIYGYSSDAGPWPYARTLEDLTRLVHTMLAFCATPEDTTPKIVPLLADAKIGDVWKDHDGMLWTLFGIRNLEDTRINYPYHWEGSDGDVSRQMSTTRAGHWLTLGTGTRRIVSLSSRKILNKGDTP